MKKFLFFSALAALLIGCKGQNAPEQVQAVQLKVSTFTQTTDQMNAPRRSPILDDEGGTALTDLYVFDGTTQLAHQTSDAQDFGTVVLNLTHGNHVRCHLLLVLFSLGLLPKLPWKTSVGKGNRQPPILFTLQS